MPSREDRLARALLAKYGLERGHYLAYRRAHNFVQLGVDFRGRDRSLWYPFWRRVCFKMRQLYIANAKVPDVMPRTRMRPVNVRAGQ